MRAHFYNTEKGERFKSIIAMLSRRILGGDGYVQHHLCEQHKKFIDAFGASSMIIGHEPVRIDSDKPVVICDDTLFMLDTRVSQWMYFDDVKQHHAHIYHINTHNEISFIKVDVHHDEFVYTWTGPIFVMGDAHGDRDTVLKLLIEAGLVEITGDALNWIGVNTLLIQLGDVIDRGPHSNNLMILFDHLRTQAELKESKVILIMGNHEYFAATDLFDNLESTKTDTECFGGLEEKKKKFSDDNAFHRQYVKSLKVAVVVNGMLFSHAALDDDDIEFFQCNLLNPFFFNAKFPEQCLGVINHIVVSLLPKSDDDFEYLSAWVYDSTLGRRVKDSISQSYCNRHKQLLDKFNASSRAMYIGHEAFDNTEENRRSVPCESIVFSDYKLSRWMHSSDEEKYTAVMFKIGGEPVEVEIDNNENELYT
eukprot:GHVR01192437.1.p1 GENE.GHVR01192437.1~~GHVR01192437.1.p1  ORF type:complete len:422 (+),score=67.33 GHVR01192437.1:112-1377(+)